MATDLSGGGVVVIAASPRRRGHGQPRLSSTTAGSSGSRELSACGASIEASAIELRREFHDRGDAQHDPVMQ